MRGNYATAFRAPDMSYIYAGESGFFGSATDFYKCEIDPANCNLYQGLSIQANQVGNPDLRSGVDVVVRPAGGKPVRLLSVHLKAGCSAGDRNEACPVLFQQVPAMERWIDARAAEDVRFAVLGDFNRRLAMPADPVWADWDDGVPAEADLSRAAGEQTARCNPRYRDFIDHIVLDRRAAADYVAFEERTFAADALSDHCAIATRLRTR